MSRARRTTPWVFINSEKELRTEKVQVELGEKAGKDGRTTTSTPSTRAKGKAKMTASATLAVAMATTCATARLPLHPALRSAMDAMAKAIIKHNVRRPILNLREKKKENQAKTAADGTPKVMEDTKVAETKEDTKAAKDMAGKDMAAREKERTASMR